MTKKRRKKKTRIGSNLVLFSAALLCLLLVPGASAEKKKGKPYGMIDVTVFRPPGFALPGAEVTVSPDPAPGQSPIKGKPWKGDSDDRGEVVFRVPVAAMRYKVHAAMKGFESQDKTVSVEGEQRVGVTFILEAESKK